MNAVVYVHGRNGNADESKHYESLFKGYDVLGFDYKGLYPWTAKEEFNDYFDKVKSKYDKVVLIANSMGACLSMYLLSGRDFIKTFFISPIVNPYQTTLTFIDRLKISMNDLKNGKEVNAITGDVVSYKYMNYFKNNEVNWDSDTVIVYGTKDIFTDRKSIDIFVKKSNSKLYIMDGGEHWFHTPEQMAFIDECIRNEYKI